MKSCNNQNQFLTGGPVSSMSDERNVSIERQSPEQAFGLLSSDLRVSIIQELGEAGEPLSFSTLRERIDEPDSGKFNYHLRKLIGHFVTKEADGYSLSLAGTQMYGAILSGAYTADAALSPIEFDGPCPLCGTDVLLAEYADEKVRLYCRECNEWRNEFTFPPASLDQYTRDELPYAFDRWMIATMLKVLQGFCSNCGGRVDGRLERAQMERPQPIQAVYECGRCGDTLTASAMLPALFHPDSITVFYKHGIDVLHDPSWQYFGPGTDVTVEEITAEPLTANVSIEFTDVSLVATIGSTGTVENVSTED